VRHRASPRFGSRADSGGVPRLCGPASRRVCSFVRGEARWLDLTDEAPVSPASCETSTGEDVPVVRLGPLGRWAYRGPRRWLGTADPSSQCGVGPLPEWYGAITESAGSRCGQDDPACSTVACELAD
jgi:hypothetical protein